MQLGTLGATLARARVPVTTHSLYLKFFEYQHMHARPAVRLSFDEYTELATQWTNTGICEWAFAVPPYGCAPTVNDARFLEHVKTCGVPRKLARKVRQLRALIPEFLECAAAEVLATKPAVVGFSTVYSQTMASVALATAIRARAPEVKILFGGANCEGEMGPAMLERFDVIDYVQRGESEAVLVELVKALRFGHGHRAIPGLCYRDGDEIRANEPTAEQRVDVTELPTPEYGEYFAVFRRSSLAGALIPRIPFESSRGCWWGMKAHCTFCGLNGTAMTYRSKAPSRVASELQELSEKHDALDFSAVDNILDMGYFRSLLPELAERSQDLSLFYEIKANLKRPQVELLRAAGVRSVQPGIESLSTPILKLMKKGATGLQNIRLLKWCAEQGIHVMWNLLYGFPDEDPAEYARMAELADSLMHFSPPSLAPVMTVRFSPYFERPEAYGLRIGEPIPYFGMIYGGESDVLRRMASVFQHEYEDGRNPKDYVGPLERKIEEWNRNAERNRGTLTYRRGPGFLVITDTRSTAPDAARYTLEATEAAAYLACDAGATLRSVRKELEAQGLEDMSEAQLRTLFRDLVEARLMIEEDGRYLSLALPALRRAGSAATMDSTIGAMT